MRSRRPLRPSLDLAVGREDLPNLEQNVRGTRQDITYSHVRSHVSLPCSHGHVHDFRSGDQLDPVLGFAPASSIPEATGHVVRGSSFDIAGAAHTDSQLPRFVQPQAESASASSIPRPLAWRQRPATQAWSPALHRYSSFIFHHPCIHADVACRPSMILPGSVPFVVDRCRQLTGCCAKGRADGGRAGVSPLRH